MGGVIGLVSRLRVGGVQGSPSGPTRLAVLRAFWRASGPLREHGINTFFSVGVAITEPIREAIRHASGWTPAIDADGDLRDGAEICEITGPVPVEGYADGTRFIVRREAAARRQALGAETRNSK